ncbi:hypothetical protein SeMB42_g06335 [Synchytrium endobioticum]|uniref:WIBG Mago-binding domain-containing protein n=1 Tax=Synchytrium endobioticum TaxID=286115 RepID=A0A507CIX0_9FUNG|nr:hypothetical protein SeMB42_g06335 [Synchytrium endobioticum]TPX43901.1 hypothetical protein SeLEV6574_g04816 [Synchytrium endobioticum]
MAGRTASGIVELPTPDGQRVIPSSRRPDGSIRKEIRVRAGYVPQEDVSKYISKAASARTSAGLVPGIGIVPANARSERMAAGKEHVYQYDDNVPGSRNDGMSRTAKKNEKRKAARAQKDGSWRDSHHSDAHDADEARVSLNSSSNSSQSATQRPPRPQAHQTSSASAPPEEVETKIKTLPRAFSQDDRLRDKGVDTLSSKGKAKADTLQSLEDEVDGLETRLRKMTV